jgi:hypothetical protein
MDAPGGAVHGCSTYLEVSATDTHDSRFCYLCGLDIPGLACQVLCVGASAGLAALTANSVDSS